MKDKIQLYKYLCFDAITALIAWAIVNGVRTMNVLRTDDFSYHYLLPEYNAKVVYPLIPFFWILIYWLSGYYNTLWFKSRLSEFVSTFITTIIGSLLLFFAILIDDPVSDYTVFIHSLLLLMAVHFCLTYASRLTITSLTIERINRGEIGLNTLILGVGSKAAKLCSDLKATPKPTGYIIKGFVGMSEDESVAVDKEMIVGGTSQLRTLISEMGICEIVIAKDDITESDIYSIIGLVGDMGVKIKFIPSRYQLITGSVKLNTLYGIPVVDLSAIKMSDSEVCIKRALDVVTSVVVMVILSPLYFLLFIIIGKNPIVSQERLGLHGKPFMMHKFSSMVIGAENGTPMLTLENDERITPLGRFMRKYRLDELPQFYNVLRGDMSIIGPRPERKYYIDQIVKVAPYYYMLQNVKPGISSWGMVKFGYANTVDKMVERAAYDILYLENASLLLDAKISIYTIRTILTGKGM
ncbi:MAG: sugar transferase [Paludibacteraceae bacterium]|nr:sugar transferase [Paludibacteraceae bacterium]